MASSIVSITGLQSLTNLENFNADYNAFTSIDFSGMSNIQIIDVSDCNDFETGENSLKSLNLSGCTSLRELRVDDSDFSEGFLNLNGLNNLEYFDADDCSISGVLDLSFLPSLKGFDLSYNEQITRVIISPSQVNLGMGQEIIIYGCSLTQESVDEILTIISQNEVTDGYLDLSGGDNSEPSETGAEAKSILVSRGWTVYTN